MEISRRTIIKSALAAGVLHALHSPGLQAADGSSPPARPLLLVLGPTGNGVQFTQGILDAVRVLGANASVSLKQLEHGFAADVGGMTRMLRDYRGTRLIGFMDDGLYAIFQELARDEGARLLSLGRHVWNCAGPHESRHAVVTASRMSTMGVLMSSILAQTGRTFLLNERILDGVMSVDAIVGDLVRVTRPDSSSRTFERIATSGALSPTPPFVTMLGRIAALAALDSPADAIETIVSAFETDGATSWLPGRAERAATLIMDL